MSSIVWIAGPPCSGKTTLARAAVERLGELRRLAYVLDGDQLRKGLCDDLGFSKPARAENVRRAAEVAGLLADAGVIVMAAFVTPTRDDRSVVRQVLGGRVRFVYLNTPLKACEARDVKGMYAAARAGRIKSFTGVDAPFEPLESADLVIDTTQRRISECAASVLTMASPCVLVSP